ncbi:hypothetical protein ACLOJK_040109, partial [Asimina triloba]
GWVGVVDIPAKLSDESLQPSFIYLRPTRELLTQMTDDGLGCNDKEISDSLPE